MNLIEEVMYIYVLFILNDQLMFREFPIQEISH